MSATTDRPKLTAKGARTRARIVEEAATLIHERGVAGTTLEDVKMAAEVSGSQMYHYFPDKNDLALAVIDFQAETIVANHRQALSGADGVEGWRNMVITGARDDQVGGCPLGSLVGQLAESDPEARAHIARGFHQWAATISDGLKSLHAAGKLPSDIDPDDLATTLLAALEGGLLLSQAGRSPRPYETAVNTLLALIIGTCDVTDPRRSKERRTDQGVR
jgi:AcrR family transcriptional regulator